MSDIRGVGGDHSHRPTDIKREVIFNSETVESVAEKSFQDGTFVVSRPIDGERFSEKRGEKRITHLMKERINHLSKLLKLYK